MCNHGNLLSVSVTSARQGSTNQARGALIAADGIYGIARYEKHKNLLNLTVQDGGAKRQKRLIHESGVRWRQTEAETDVKDSVFHHVSRFKKKLPFGQRLSHFPRFLQHQRRNFKIVCDGLPNLLLACLYKLNFLLFSRENKDLKLQRKDGNTAPKKKKISFYYLFATVCFTSF